MNAGNFNTNVGANFADTGQWKLIVSVSAHGISAFLKNIYDVETEPVILFKRDWECEPEEILGNVEAAVYDHPRILDDFATHIIVYTPKSLWIPTAMTDEEEFNENFFTCVYPTAPEDISADFGEEETCLYTLIPGLNSFLQRTLPGCKVTSHLSVLKPRFEKEEKLKMDFDKTRLSVETLYVNIRDNETDIFAFKDGRFLCGATHNWVETSDIAYKTLLIADTYGLDIRKCEVNVFAHPGVARQLTAILEEFAGKIAVRQLPDMMAKHGIPLSASLIAGDPI